MLNIYLSDDKLPSDLKYVFDNETYFGRYEVKDSLENRMIIKHVEQGEYFDSTFFKDRFGGLLYLSLLSTSSKILLNVQNNPDKVFNGDELGVNALNVLTSLSQGNIILRGDYRWFSEQVIPNNNFKVNNILCTSQDDFERIVNYA